MHRPGRLGRRVVERHQCEHGTQQGRRVGARHLDQARTGLGRDARRRKVRVNDGQRVAMAHAR
jgi:hypothetical protein